MSIPFILRTLKKLIIDISPHKKNYVTKCGDDITSLEIKFLEQIGSLFDRLCVEFRDTELDC